MALTVPRRQSRTRELVEALLFVAAVVGLCLAIPFDAGPPVATAASRVAP